MKFTSIPYCTLIAAGALWFIATAGGNAAHPTLESLQRDPADMLWQATNGTIEKAETKGVSLWRWRPNAGQTAELRLRASHPVFDKLRYFDRLQFRFRVMSGEIDNLSLRALGHVSGPRQYKQHQWNLALRTTPMQVWHERDIDLTRPNWLPWDNPDGEGREGYFHFETVAMAPGTVIELAEVRLVHSAVLIKPFYEMPVTWPILTTNADGSITYNLTVHALNMSGLPADITARLVSTHRRFKVNIETAKVETKANIVAQFPISVTMIKSDIAATPELYTERLRVVFNASSCPEAEAVFDMPMVRPLSKGLHRQVIVPEKDLQAIRDQVAGDKDMRKAADYDRVLKSADEFLTKDLRTLPPGQQWPGSNPGTDWIVGESMPEIVNKKTGAKETGSLLSGLVWKRYLAYPGFATENLGLAYLFTGDEKYAEKAIKLFRLYARQYTELPWGGIGELPWLAGSRLQMSSRIASGSGYGSNIFMRNHMRLLSMISGSPAWTPEERTTIYADFAVPYAAELIKFVGGINNQTDISSHNLALLGLVFDDALMLHQSALSDAGLVARINDIDRDGFSSEGRPIGYQLAGMAEYLPAVGYLEASGLRLPFDRQRLLAAIRMPYLRTTLTGWAPNCGDCARGFRAGASPLAAHLIPMFPEEKWLLDVGATGTLSAKVRNHLAGTKPDPEAWRSLMETKPTLFRDTGFAILRSGTSAEDQVMVTLDYGRANYHTGFNRNQVSLAAFGALFTHDPGSLYNVGAGGMTRTKDTLLDSFALNHSIGFNVIVADARDQDHAIGRLLAWSAKPDFQVAVSRVDGVYVGVHHTRGVVLTEGLVIVLDRVESDTEHTYDFAYHNLGKLTLGAGWTAQDMDRPLGTTANYESIQHLKRLKGAGPVRLSWDMTDQLDAQPIVRASGAAIDLWHLPAPGGEVFTGTTGLSNPNLKIYPDYAPSMFHRVKARTAAFITVLEPRKGAAARVQSVAATVDGGVTVQMLGGRSLTLNLDELLRQHPAK